MREISESDWKTFKRVRELALERYSQRILDEIAGICSDTNDSAHERYQRLVETVRERKREMSNAFDRFSRSSALLCLRVIRSMDLLEESEVSQFSETAQKVTKPEL